MAQRSWAGPDSGGSPPSAPASPAAVAGEDHLTDEDRLANRDRLAVVILVTDFKYKSTDRLERLRAVIRLAEKHLRPSTPYVIYIFTHPEGLPKLRKGLAGLLDAHVLPLAVLPESWVPPEAARNESTWHGQWNLSYRMMGDWRLGFMGPFARDRGHRYVLQIDDDSYITGPVKENLVELFDRGGYKIGAQRFIKETSPLVTWGLPELARYFLMAYQLQPATLFQHCYPPSIVGLYSAISKSMAKAKGLGKAATMFDVPTTGGWDLTVVNGNFVMISLDFWFQPMVQAFIQLCRTSGGSVMYRWNEQSVMGMVAQIFVDQDKLYNFTFPYKHRGSGKSALRIGKIKG